LLRDEMAGELSQVLHHCFGGGMSHRVVSGAATAAGAKAHGHIAFAYRPRLEIKASVASYLVLQKGKDVWLCYMLATRSTCEPAE